MELSNPTADVTSTPEATPEVKTYTQEELESHVARAITEYSKKVKEKAAKSTDERIAELEKEIARRDNLEAVRSSMKESSIPDSLESLFLGEGYEDKIKAFSDWYKKDKEATEKSLISHASPIHLDNSDISAKPKHRTLAEINASYE